MSDVMEQAVTVDTAKDLGLLPEEFQKIKEYLGRTPNFTELSIYSVMWSEHCSYKNSIVWLKTLPKDGPHMLVAAGEENALKIRIYGEKGGLEWAQHEPNTLLVKWLDAPAQILRAGGNYGDRLSSYAVLNTRTPGGHPEGYLEAFGNIYRNFARTLTARIDGVDPIPEALDFPGVEDGIRGMAFIDNVVASSQSEQKWTEHIV